MQRIPNLFRLLRRRGKRLHRNQQGDEGVNKTLIIALIGVPMVAVLVAFASSATGWLKEKQGEAVDKKGTIEQTFTPKSE